MKILTDTVQTEIPPEIINNVGALYYRYIFYAFSPKPRVPYVL